MKNFRDHFDEMMERRIIGKLATILVPILLAALAWAATQLWAGKTEDKIHLATLAAATDYTDSQTADMKQTLEWMAATMEAKWNVRRPRSR